MPRRTRKAISSLCARSTGLTADGRLKEIATGHATPEGHDWSRVALVYPVLVVFDNRMDRPGHGEFLAEEFAKALEPDVAMPTGYMRKGRFTIAPMAIMTIADLELLESSVDHVRLTDLLKDYAQSGHKGIRESFHDYLAMAAPKKYKLSLRKLRMRALPLIDEAHKAMFPNIPIPEVPARAIED